MNFRDRGIIIAKRSLKERISIITLFTESHGLYSGAIRETNKKMGDSLVEGNLVDFFWTARLHEHLGSAKCELIQSYNQSIVANKTKLYAFNSIISLIKKAFHEREPHNNFFPVLLEFLQKTVVDFTFRDYIKLEIEILTEAGYTLQLDSCVASGSREDLFYVSPKSGCAVSRKMGEPFADKLLRLPEFLIKPTLVTEEQKKQAFALTSYFLNRHILCGAQLLARNIFIEHISNQEMNKL
jgi:DNA repair protein RecO (recombination protein O)